MISLDLILMKSSEVRIAGDRSNIQSQGVPHRLEERLDVQCLSNRSKLFVLFSFLETFEFKKI